MGSRILLGAVPAFVALAARLSAADSPPAVLESLLEKLKEGTRNVPQVLNLYGRIESAGEIDPFGRLRIHQGLLKALREMGDAGLAEEADRFLQLSGDAFLPGQVLLLKTLLGPNFPASREVRLQWLVRASRGKEERISIWGARLLGDSGWPEAVEALIDLLHGEEEANRPETLLASVVRGELYRVLGAPASSGASLQIRTGWEAMGKKVPPRPEYRPGAGGSPTGFFGDRISPRAVFVLDASSSMLQRATLAEGQGTTALKREKDAPRVSGEKKIEIVRAELLRALDQLQPHFRFNVLTYHSTTTPWRGRGRLQLHPATSTSLKSAGEFARKIQVDSGTNIHDSLSQALEIPEVETVYLLSDGVPSRGGGPAAIERRVEALNYLRGARIIAYGFSAEERGAFDEEFMKRLARENWGWYRRLNR